MTTEIEATQTARRSVAHRYLVASAAFAVFGAVLLAFNSMQLLWPDLGKGVAFLTYGRVRPMSLSAVVYGWLALGLLGAAFHIVPKLTGSALWRPRLASVALALTSVSVAGGIVAVGAGFNHGDFLFEFPTIADAGIAIGLAISAFVLIRSAAATAESNQPALWFAVAGALWLPLGFVAGAVPGLKGVNAALQNAFGITSVITLALVSLALGAAYYVAGELRGSHEGSSVARIGFWSFAFIAAWTAPRLLLFGPAPDWLETISVAFSVILLVPTLALLSDLAGLLRGVAQRKLVVAGGSFLIAFVVLNMISSFRSPSSLTRLTSWEDALLLLPLLGTAGSWLLAFTHHIAGRGARWTGVLLVDGTGIAVLAFLAGGLQQGISWVGGANEGAPVSGGEAFALASTALVALAAIGVTVAAVGMVGFALGVLRSRGDRSAELALEYIPDEEGPEVAEPIAFPVLVRGAVALFALAAASVFLIPTLDAPNRTATLAADATEFAEGSLPAIGAELYVSEGCVYCHTQQVRPIITDVGLGAVSVPGDYARQTPALLGYRRVGPDLTHIGSRTTSTRGLLERLRSPRASFDDGGGGGWEIMPSYDYLSDDDLLAIAEYLGALN
ncbi:MAG: cbb3-type cytochrome c oxidase subunit II [Acidimicrobiia bacterium]|nr:cbb3-type cytochrome c oxidase subunit II [Acidimicrobiia bacterium]